MFLIYLFSCVVAHSLQHYCLNYVHNLQILTFAEHYMQYNKVDFIVIQHNFLFSFVILQLQRFINSIKQYRKKQIKTTIKAT